MDTKLNPSEVVFASDLRLRPAQWTDLNAVAQLMYDVWEEDGDTTMAATPDDLRIMWKKPGFDLEHDTFVVETQDGQLVGYDQFDNRYRHAILEVEGYVHPGFKGRGIGTSLLRITEKRAYEEFLRAEPDVRISLRSPINNRDRSAHTFIKRKAIVRSAITGVWRSTWLSHPRLPISPRASDSALL